MLCLAEAATKVSLFLMRLLVSQKILPLYSSVCLVTVRTPRVSLYNINRPLMAGVFNLRR